MLGDGLVRTGGRQLHEPIMTQFISANYLCVTKLQFESQWTQLSPGTQANAMAS